MFGVYNRDQVVPSAPKFIYLSSRSALECAIISTMGLWGSDLRGKERPVSYEYRDDFQMPLLANAIARKYDRSFIKKSSRIKKHWKCVTFTVCTEKVLS